MTQLVTGEAVRLEVRPATFASRAVSGVIDVFLQGAVLFAVVAIFLTALEAVDDAAEAALSLVLVIGVLVGLPTLVETLSRGRTPGKLVMGLRTVRDDGGPIRFRYAMVRALIGFIEIFLFFGVPALIASLFTERGKRLGDVAAGTFVIRERNFQQSGPMALAPPHLVAWARAADIRRLPDGIALTARQFLSRSAQLQSEPRLALGNQLAARLAPFVAPPPPSGTHAEDFLAAVLAERRERDLVRLAREQEIRERLARVDSVEAAMERVHRPGAPAPSRTLHAGMPSEEPDIPSR
ncbi:MAG: RDD family protein [Angustibacter sp.]